MTLASPGLVGEQRRRRSRPSEIRPCADAVAASASSVSSVEPEPAAAREVRPIISRHTVTGSRYGLACPRAPARRRSPLGPRVNTVPREQQQQRDLAVVERVQVLRRRPPRSRRCTAAAGRPRSSPVKPGPSCCTGSTGTACSVSPHRARLAEQLDAAPSSSSAVVAAPLRLDPDLAAQRDRVDTLDRSSRVDAQPERQLRRGGVRLGDDVERPRTCEVAHRGDSAALRRPASKNGVERRVRLLAAVEARHSVRSWPTSS